MADIELVIKIPKVMYTQIMDENGIETMLIPYKDIIKNGTPIPEGHGRLGDLDALREEVCSWIKYDYRTVCPKEHDIENPYWRIPENRMDALKYCPYCGKEIEVEK